MRQIAAVSAVAAAAAFFASACSKDAVVLTPSTVRKADGTPLGEIPAFTKIKVRHMPFTDDAWTTVIEGPLAGDIRADTLASLPAPTTTFFVKPVFAVVHANPSTVVPTAGAAAAEGIRRPFGGLKIDGVALAKDDVVVFERGFPIGYIRASDVVDKQPAAADFWKMCDGALRDLKESDAREAAEATLVVDEKNVPALSTLSSLLAVSDVARSKELEDRARDAAAKKGAEKPLPDVVSGAEIAAGSDAFVVAVSAALRDADNDKAPLVQTLDIDTPVAVVDVKGAWARVRLVAGTISVDVKNPLAEGGAPAADIYAGVQNGATQAGWLKKAALGLERPTTDALSARVDKTKDRDEALVLAQRALALSPWQAALRKKVVDVALSGARYGDAGRAVREYDPHASVNNARADVDVLYACHGDPTKAKTVPGAGVSSTDTFDDACADYAPTLPCAPGSDDDHCGYGDDGYEHDATDGKTDAVLQAEAAAAAAKEAAELAEANVEYTKQVEDTKKQTAIVDAIFTRGPMVRVTMSNLARLSAGRKVYFFEQKQEPSACEGPHVSEATFVEIPLPSPVPKGDVVFYADVTAGESYGVFSAFADDVTKPIENVDDNAGLPTNAIALTGEPMRVPTEEPGDCSAHTCCGD